MSARPGDPDVELTNAADYQRQIARCVAEAQRCGLLPARLTGSPQQTGWLIHLLTRDDRAPQWHLVEALQPFIGRAIWLLRCKIRMEDRAADDELEARLVLAELRASLELPGAWHGESSADVDALPLTATT
jgi:hypothetical protein